MEIMSPQHTLPPAIAVTICANGYIDVRKLGLDRPMTAFRSYQNDSFLLTQHFMHLLYNVVLKELPTEQPAAVIAHGYEGILNRRLSDIAQRLVEELTIPMPDTDLPIPSEHRKPEHPDDDITAANNMIYSAITRDIEKPEPYKSYCSHDANERRQTKSPNPKAEDPHCKPEEFNNNLIIKVNDLAAEESPWWIPIKHEKTEQGDVIKVMFNDGNEPVYSISRLQDGSINVNPPVEQSNFNFNGTKPENLASHAERGDNTQAPVQHPPKSRLPHG